MKNSKGMTLMEMTLTIMLMSILMMSLYYYMQTQRLVCKRLRNNTIAIFALESMRNHIKEQLSQGRSLADTSSESLKKLIGQDSWEVGLEMVYDDPVEKIVITLFNNNADGLPCTYATEVKAYE